MDEKTTAPPLDKDESQVHEPAVPVYPGTEQETAVHTEAPATEKYPVTHAVQVPTEEAPVAALFVPAEHWVQVEIDVAPLTAE